MASAGTWAWTVTEKIPDNINEQNSFMDEVVSSKVKRKYKPYFSHCYFLTKSQDPSLQPCATPITPSKIINGIDNQRFVFSAQKLENFPLSVVTKLHSCSTNI